MRVWVRRTLLAAAAVIAVALATIRICADGGAMASSYRTCDCAGLEWKLYDRTAADGPQRTICLGLVRSRTCYQFRSGPTVACPE
jgi:hypothetical protein